MAEHRQRAHPAPTTAELKASIDAGRTGDKVPGFDPAAAPLGTDEEAAGTPLPPAARRAAQEAEQRITARPLPGFAPKPGESIAPDADPAKPRGYFGAAVAIAVLSLAAVLISFVMMAGQR